MGTAQHEALTLTERAWCDEAAQGLAIAARGDIDWIRREVEQGIATLYQGSGCSTGWLVLRLDKGAHGPELVLVAAQGTNMKPVVRYLMDTADRRGWQIRTHIQRPGLERIYERLGWHRAEVVMRYGR